MTVVTHQLFYNLGLELFKALEPIWRELSTLSNTALNTRHAATRSVRLFLEGLERSLPLLLEEGITNQDRLFCPPRLISVRHPRDRIVSKAVSLLRGDLASQWTVELLAKEVALSRSQFARIFRFEVGMTPMRFLSEIRLTEFARLVEESDIPLAAAAREVGWVDSRVAATWYRRRFGVSPSTARAHMRRA